MSCETGTLANPQRKVDGRGGACFDRRPSDQCPEANRFRFDRVDPNWNWRRSVGSLLIRCGSAIQSGIPVRNRPDWVGVGSRPTPGPDGPFPSQAGIQPDFLSDITPRPRVASHSSFGIHQSFVLSHSSFLGEVHTTEQFAPARIGMQAGELRICLNEAKGSITFLNLPE